MVMRLSTCVPVILSLLVSACQVRIPEDKDGAFTYAVEAVQHEAYRRGADAAWVFLDSADPDDPRYDRGLRLLARSAEGLELPWAAGMLYREIAQRRQNMEIIPVALRGLERIVESGVYDEDSLLTSFIAGEEFGDLPPDVQAFVSYYKGLDLLRHGYDAWAEANFSRIGPRGPYAARAEYARAVRLVAAGDFATATEKLVALRNRPDVDARLEADIERTLARMAFEEQAYEVALKHYEAIRYLAPEDPEILLEMAWTYYYLGDSRKTLGLLVALNAPAYRRYISPERYLLEALALRRLCQFEAARHATVKLERRFAPSLAALDAGVLPREIP